MLLSGQEKKDMFQDPSKFHGYSWDQAYNNRSFHTLQDQIVYKDSGNPLGLILQNMKTSWAIAYMIELANQRAGIANGSRYSY